MSMSFWETVRGARLADTLIEHLPKLAEPKRSSQYIIEKGSYAEAIAELKKVYSTTKDTLVTTLVDRTTGAITLVLEKEEEE